MMPIIPVAFQGLVTAGSSRFAFFVVLRTPIPIAEIVFDDKAKCSI